MSGLVSFIVTLFTVIVWLMALSVTGIIVLYFTNMPLLAKWLSNISTKITEKVENDHTDKGGLHHKKGKRSDVKDDSTLNEKTEQVLAQIKMLGQKIQVINALVQKNDESISFLRNQLLTVQENLSKLTGNNSQENNYPRKEHIGHRDSLKQYHHLYAYAPTSVSPYGFTNDDWQPCEGGQTFVMAQTSDTEASFSINANCPDSNILNYLAYYNRLIDYEDYTKGGNASRIEVTEKGSLNLVGDVWTIEKKIKIKLL